MDATFNLFKVRFTILDDLLSSECKYLTKDSKVNIFINLEPVMRKLLNVTNEKYSRVSKINVKEFTSNVINLASHYRLFFSKNKMYSKIYLYFQTPQSSYINSSLISNYRDTYYHNLTKHPQYKNLGNVISDSIDIIQLICEYIEGVYFIESGSIENSLVPMLVNQEVGDTSFKNFIVTNDPYDFQYVNYGYDIIFPKKENSAIVNRENLFEFIKEKERVQSSSNPNTMTYPFVLSIIGDKRRNIPKISRMGLATILKTIDKAIEKQVITDKTFNINLLTNIVRDDFKATILNNYYVIDLKTQLNVLCSNDLYFISKQIKDKFDDDSLKRINDLYFSEVPIQLIEVCSGTKYKEKQDSDDIFRLRR